MLKRSSVVLAIAALLAAGLVTAGPVQRTLAQSGLRIGGAAANFGVFNLAGGFLPDPAQYAVTSGGSLDASTLGLAPNCRGFVTAQPDVIVRYSNPASFLRFYVRAPGDTTLVINDGAGHWHCSDDEGGGLNPMIDLARPAAGQYDIWVGSYRAGENIRTTLHVTELTGNRP